MLSVLSLRFVGPLSLTTVKVMRPRVWRGLWLSELFDLRVAKNVFMCGYRGDKFSVL